MRRVGWLALMHRVISRRHNRWLQKGLDARREWGAYPLRYVTNEQRRRRTLFKPTLWAAASWLIFGVAHSLRIDLDMLVVTASPARTALKISQPIRRPPDGMPPTYDSMH